MKKVSFNYPNGKGKVQPNKLEGYAFDCDGVTLVVHKNINAPWWSLSELSTGMGISMIKASTRKAVINRAIQHFLTDRPAHFHQMVRHINSHPRINSI